MLFRISLISTLVLMLVACDPNNPPTFDLQPTPDPPNPCQVRSCRGDDGALSEFCFLWPAACQKYTVARLEVMFGGLYPKITTCGQTTMLTWRAPLEVLEAYYDMNGDVIGGGYFANLATSCKDPNPDKEFSFKTFYARRPSCCATAAYNY